MWSRGRRLGIPADKPCKEAEASARFGKTTGLGPGEGGGGGGGN